MASAEWKCAECGESVPADFDICWNCGTDRSGVSDPEFKPAVGFTPQCGSCGYLLIGLESLVCPECGNPFDPTQKDTMRDVDEAM